MKFTLSLLLLFTLSLNHAFAATDNCKKLLKPNLSQGWVKQMIEKQNAKPDQLLREEKIVRLAGIEPIFEDRQILANHNDSYTNELPSGTITDQKGSGRCWDFASENVLRSCMIQANKLRFNFEFSQTYVWFYHFLEQANAHFERIIRHPSVKYLSDQSAPIAVANISEGGDFQPFAYIVKKYGLVPKAVMPETAATVSPTNLMKDLNRQVAITSNLLVKAQEAKKSKIELRKIKDQGNQAVFNLLAIYLGTPPTQFEMKVSDLQEGIVNQTSDVIAPQQITNQGKTIRFTPQQFAKKYVGFNPDDYVMIGTYSIYETNQHYSFKRSRAKGDVLYNDMPFLNLSNERAQELVVQSINAKNPVYFAADIRQDNSVDYANRPANKKGILHPGIMEHSDMFGKVPGNVNLTNAEEYYYNLDRPVHAMTIVGYDRPDPTQPVVKFKVENSWGENAGDHGFYAMYTGWFEQHLYEIVVRKSLLTPEELKLLKQKPIPLAPTGD